MSQNNGTRSVSQNRLSFRSNIIIISMVVFILFTLKRNFFPTTYRVSLVVPDTRPRVLVAILKENPLLFIGQNNTVEFDENGMSYIPTAIFFEEFHTLTARTRSGEVVPVERFDTTPSEVVLRELGSKVVSTKKGKYISFGFCIGTKEQAIKNKKF